MVYYTFIAFKRLIYFETSLIFGNRNRTKPRFLVFPISKICKIDSDYIQNRELCRTNHLASFSKKGLEPLSVYSRIKFNTLTGLKYFKKTRIQYLPTHLRWKTKKTNDSLTSWQLHTLISTEGRNQLTVWIVCLITPIVSVSDIIKALKAFGNISEKQASFGQFCRVCLQHLSDKDQRYVMKAQVQFGMFRLSPRLGFGTFSMGLVLLYGWLLCDIYLDTIQDVRKECNGCNRLLSNPYRTRSKCE